MRLVLVLFLVHFLAGEALAQRPRLMLQMRNPQKCAYYKEGDEIAFRIDGYRSKIKGTIIGIRDSILVLPGYEIPIRMIRYIYIDEKTRWWLRYKIEQGAFLLGGGYLLADVLNSKSISPETATFSGSMIALGVAAKLIIGNKIKINHRRKLRVIRY